MIVKALATAASAAGLAQGLPLHSCHAQFRTDNPIFSALHLADGVLTAEAIESLRLPGATVVLSGCETALHDSANTDEMFGLTRAFLVAGAARVMATLWPVTTRPPPSGCWTSMPACAAASPRQQRCAKRKWPRAGAARIRFIGPRFR